MIEKSSQQINDNFVGHYREWREKRIQAIIEHYGQKFFEDKTLLELGCGHGDIGATFASLGAKVTCSDGREEHLIVLKEKYPHIKTALVDLDKEWSFESHYDMIIMMGIVYHLRNHEDILKKVCSSTTYLVLETEVCDYADDTAVVKTYEEGYDQALNFNGCRPSETNIECILNQHNMAYERILDDRCNSSFHRYDWLNQNTGKYDHGLRRFWFAHQKSPVDLFKKNYSNNYNNKIADYLQYVNNRYLKLNQQQLLDRKKHHLPYSRLQETKKTEVLMSVVIPTSGRVNLLIETLESLTKQTVKNFEVIISDDSPNEKDRLAIRDLVSLFQKKVDVTIHYIFSEPKLYQARNTNQGLLKANGEIIRILHSDDVLSPITLEKEINFFRTNTDKINVAYHDILPFSHIENLNWDKKDETNFSLISPAYLLSTWLHSATAIPSGLVFTKQALENTSLLDANYHFLCDWKFFYELVINELKNKTLIGHFSAGLVGWRVHSNSVTGRLWNTHFLEHEMFINEILYSQVLEKELCMNENDKKHFLKAALSYRYKRLIQDYMNLQLQAKVNQWFDLVYCLSRPGIGYLSKKVISKFLKKLLNK